MTQEPTADRVVDSRGTLCPLPVVDTKRAIDEMASGQILKLLATDPGSESDMKAWSRRTGHQILYAKTEDKVFTFYIQKS
ncbi:MAG: sulfurtransferase TusA family protein [Chloroflexi bacterium]|nr:sulfurtransferase TusA family protein [Chloroflexota bacterium]